MYHAVITDTATQEYFNSINLQLQHYGVQHYLIRTKITCILNIFILDTFIVF